MKEREPRPNKQLNAVLTHDEYRTLMDLLWQLNHQWEKVYDYRDSPTITRIRGELKTTTLNTEKPA